MTFLGLTTWCFLLVSSSTRPPADEVLVGRLLDRISGGGAGDVSLQFALETLRRLDDSIVPQVNGRLEQALALPNLPADNLCEVLEAHPDVRSVPVLLRCLQDPELRVQTRAIQLLGAIGSPEAVMPMLVYSRGAPEYQKQLVTHAVIRIGGKDAKLFTRTLLDQPSFDASQIALAAYRLWKEPEILPILRERLRELRRGSRNDQARNTVAWTLGVLGDSDGRDHLLEALVQPGPWPRRRFVIAALGDIGGEAVERALVERIAIAEEEELISLLHALAESGGEVAHRELRDQVTASSRRVQQEALSGLATLGDDGPAWTLWQEMREAPWSATVQDWITFYVSRLGDRRVVPDLLSWFATARGVRREFLLRALGYAADPRAIPVLIEVLLSESKEVRQGVTLANLATQAMANLGSEATPALLEAWGRAEAEDQQERVLTALRNLGDRLGASADTRRASREIFDWMLEQFENASVDRKVFLVEGILPGFYDIRLGRWLWQVATDESQPEEVLQAVETAKRRFF